MAWMSVICKEMYRYILCYLFVVLLLHVTDYAAQQNFNGYILMKFERTSNYFYKQIIIIIIGKTALFGP
jgi:hypothetical protein